MIIFNELRITADNKCLIIDVSIDNHSYFDDLTIDYIKIDTNKTFVTKDKPSDKAVDIPLQDLDSLAPSNSIYNPRHIRKVLTQSDLKALDLDINNALLFVYVHETGVISEEVPCCFDRDLYMQTVANLIPLYNIAIANMKELNNTCSIPKNFIDSILRFKALELCIKTGNYTRANKLWNDFFSGMKVITPPNNCCNGNN